MPTRVANLNQISTAAHRMFAGQDPKKNCEVLSAWIQRIPISTYRTPFKQFQHRYLLGSSSVYADNGDISQYTHVDLGGTKHPFHGNKFPFPPKKHQPFHSGSMVCPHFVRGAGGTICLRYLPKLANVNKDPDRYPNSRVVNQQWQDVNKRSFHKDGLEKN